ncbi:nSTAND1 domain-containing NTPase [Streptomyces parvus]|uniref:nSTAND1 domain-containing NTPase n=1 Tax=Streptomyces parvus TaxID=66428 RepID=UPI00363FA7E8
MAESRGQSGGRAESALSSAVVRVKGSDGAVGGAGFLVSADLVLTCAHVVSDALDRPREETVAAGTEVTVDVPLAGNVDGVDGVEQSAEVWRWIPIRPDQAGDIAVLRLRNRIPGTRPLPLVDPPDGVWDHDARTVGFTDENPGGIWQRGRFLGPTGQGWIQLSRSSGEVPYIKGGFSGSPVWSDDMGAAVGMMVAAQPGRETQQAFALRTRAVLKELPELTPLISPAGPFRGLSTFQENDADVFFGRNDDIRRAVTALRGDQRTVTVYGPSGCGKSSLALAGVVPALRQEGYLIMRVNATSFSSLRAALATELFEIARAGGDGPPRARNAGEVEEWLTGLGLTDTVHRVLGAPADRILVVLDQAEALLAGSGEAADEAADMLLAEPRQTGFRVLVTLRADFMGAALSHARFGSVLEQGVTVPLRPMGREQLAEVISEPLKRIPAVEYDPGLERRILDDAGEEPGTLPLLGFVLAQLWGKRVSGRLRTTTYEEIGGVSGALRLHAERAWKRCVEERAGREGDKDTHTKEALRLLTGLVRVLPGGEAPLRRVLTRDEVGAARWAIAEALAEHRLLVVRGGQSEPQSVELAHEALISAWPELARQVKADEEFLAARADLRHDLDRWQRASRSPDLLPGVPRLNAPYGRLEGRETDLTPGEREFLDIARRRHRTRRNRRRTAGVAVALVFALIAGLGAFLWNQSRTTAEREAEGRSRSLARISDQLAERDPAQAALAAMAAYEVSPTQEARSAMLRRYDQTKDLSWILSGAEGEISDLATSENGRVVLAATEMGRATLFVRTAGGGVLQEHLRLPGLVEEPLVSRDGRRIGYVMWDGQVFWREVRVPSGGERGLLGAVRTLHGRTNDILGRVITGDFSADGRRLATMTHNGRVRVWDLAKKSFRQVPGQVRDAMHIQSGPDSDTVLVTTQQSVSGTSTIATMDVGTGRTRELARGVAAWRVSGNRGVVTVCREGESSGDEARYQSLRVSDSKRLNHYVDTDGFCGAISVDTAGTYFAAHTGDGRWALVENRPEAKAIEYAGPYEDAVSGVLLGAPDRPMVITRFLSTVSGVALNRKSSGGGMSLITNHRVLLDGDLLVARLGGLDGDKLQEGRLAVLDLGDDENIVAEVPLPSREVTRNSSAPFQAKVLAVNQQGTLTANVVGEGEIVIHELPSLKELARVKPVPPPVDERGIPEAMDLVFTSDGGGLVTRSGSRIEYWDARGGHRLSRGFDVRELGLTEEEQQLYSPAEQLGDTADYRISPDPLPGRVEFMARGKPVSHVIDLQTGKEIRKLRLELGPDIHAIIRDGGGRRAAALTRGTMVELWSVDSGQPPERVMGQLGPLNDDGLWVAGFTKNHRFFLANGNAVRFQDVSDPGRFELYDFEEDQEFLAASKDGKTLLRFMDGASDTIRLDPALWKQHLCEIVDRNFTADERTRLPSGLPDITCPSAA